MGISQIIKSILGQTKKIEVVTLPTQGMFYPQDIEIKVKKADLEDIIDYEYNYDKENLYAVIESVKSIVRKNTLFNDKYRFEDIKSVDIVYIFLEIVKITTKKPIEISFFNDEIGKLDVVEFNNKNFNYFNFDKYDEFYDKMTYELVIDGYRFSMPSIGSENCVTNFLVSKTNDTDCNKWSDYNYDFLFFLGNRNNLTFSEVENLITIFNFDIDDTERDKIRKIVNEFLDVVSYSIKFNNKVIDIKSKLDLETIWK